LSDSKPHKILKNSFLFIVIFQALHSLEEFCFKLWVQLPPARFLSSLISDDLSVGFAVLNLCIVAFAVWSYLVPIRRGSSCAFPLMWFWACLEFLNGSGHLWFGLSAGGYFPGVLTAPFLIATSTYLAFQLSTNRQPAQ